MAIPDPRGVPQIGPANWSNGFLPAVFQGTAFNADDRSQPEAAGRCPADDATCRPRFLASCSTRSTSSAIPATPSLTRRIASYELAARMQLEPPEVSDLSNETQDDARAVRHRRAEPASGRFRPQLPAGPAAAGARRALRAALQWRLRDGRGRRQLGRPPPTEARL